MTVKNEKWVVIRHGEGDFSEDDFKFESEELPAIEDGEIRVEVAYCSCDPTQINWTRVDSYQPRVPLGGVVRAYGVGTVSESKSDKFKVGDRVRGYLGFQRFWQGEPAGLNKLLPSMKTEDALSAYSSIGATAWQLYDIGNPKAGETIVVTGAAGAVGMLVCQLAKARSCRVVAIAGSAKKLEALGAIGVDVTINYKDSDLGEQLKTACPKGIDVYWENVGGKTTELAWPLLNLHARVICCGMISTYTQGAGMGEGEKPSLPLYNTDIIAKRIKIQGFICSDYIVRWPAIFEELGQLMSSGKLEARLDVVNGIENAISALAGLFKGDNIGKRVVRVT